MLSFAKIGAVKGEIEALRIFVPFFPQWDKIRYRRGPQIVFVEVDAV
jgi:hypothetical protein